MRSCYMQRRRCSHTSHLALWAESLVAWDLEYRDACPIIKKHLLMSLKKAARMHFIAFHCISLSFERANISKQTFQKYSRPNVCFGGRLEEGTVASRSSSSSRKGSSPKKHQNHLKVPTIHGDNDGLLSNSCCWFPSDCPSWDVLAVVVVRSSAALSIAASKLMQVDGNKGTCVPQQGQ